MVFSGKIYKYLAYALGEILLVVIGILIALQINNYNDARKNKLKVDTLLEKIQKNIESDMDRINRLLSQYAVRDSLLTLVLNNKVTEEDYKDPNSFQLHSLILSYDQINLKKDGYENLIRQQDIIPSEYDSIVEKLNVLYTETYDFVEVSENQYKNRVIDYGTNVAMNHDWLSDQTPFFLNQKKIDHHLNDLSYRGMAVIHKSSGIGDYLTFIIQYREQAFEIYKMIDDQLGRQRFNQHLSNYFKIDTSIVGQYRLFNGAIAEVHLKENALFTKVNDLDFMLHQFGPSRYANRGVFFRFSKEGDDVLIFSTNYESGQKPIAEMIK